MDSWNILRYWYAEWFFSGTCVWSYLGDELYRVHGTLWDTYLLVLFNSYEYMHLFGIVCPWIAYAMIFLCMKTPTWSVMAPVLSLTSKKGGDKPMDVTATSWFHYHTWQANVVSIFVGCPAAEVSTHPETLEIEMPFRNEQTGVYLFLNSRRWRGRKREREIYIYMIHTHIYILVCPRANINGRTGCKRTSITGTGCHIVWSHRFLCAHSRKSACCFVLEDWFGMSDLDWFGMSSAYIQTVEMTHLIISQCFPNIF